jgi:hypothetical protein
MDKMDCPRASLIGLPPELRLRIYEHLFVQKPSEDDPHGPTSYCVSTGVMCHIQHKKWPPALLRTCKQIFNEAIPVIASQLEVNVGIPSQSWPFSRDLVAHTSDAASNIPTYIAEFILRARIDAEMDMVFLQKEKLEPTCAALEDAFPRLQNIRFQLVMNHWDDDNYNGDLRNFAIHNAYFPAGDWSDVHCHDYSDRVKTVVSTVQVASEARNKTWEVGFFHYEKEASEEDTISLDSQSTSSEFEYSWRPL